MRWYFFIELEWEFQPNSNILLPLVVDLYELFVSNLDETYFMYNDGALKIIGVTEITYNKNTSNSRVSITTVRYGSAAGVNGPVVFLDSYQNENRTFSNYYLKNIYGLPEGTKVLTNNSAYIDDATLRKSNGTRNQGDVSN